MSDGDEWKGEPEIPKISWSIWGPQLTPEQEAEMTRHLSERRAKGRMLAATLTKYREDARCAKCGHGKSRTVYCAGQGGGVCVDHAGDVPHLHRDCKRCRYTWYELPLDADV